MKNLFKLSYLAVALSVLSCTNDLNTIPKDDDQFLSDNEKPITHSHEVASLLEA